MEKYGGARDMMEFWAKGELSFFIFYHHVCSSRSVAVVTRA